MRRLGQLTALGICSAPLAFELPNWAHASWVGACWGTLLLTGLGVAWTQHRVAWSLFSVANMLLAYCSQLRAIDLGGPAVWLVTVGLVACGWLMGIVLVPWQNESRTPGLEPHTSNADQRSLRICSWDIFCATAFIAMLCSTLPNLENQFDLACQIAPAFIGGIVLSILALQWAWRDNWSIISMASSLLCVPLVALLSVPWFQTSLSLGSLILWLFTGPISVMAAQFMIVLLGVASVRRPRQAYSI